LTQIIRLLLTMIPQQRRRVLREEQHSYQITPETADRDLLDALLQDIPSSD
jgi:hypothetical protein